MKTETRFEDLTDEQAQQVALAFGLFRWKDRADLNRVWYKFESNSLQGSRDMSMRSINPEIAAKIDGIDLTNCTNRLMDAKLGKGWSKEKAEDQVRKYRNFLKMISTGMTCVPTKDVDEVWHTHILDTESYAKDCQRCFGYFVHHRPYLADDALKTAWKDTNAAYKGTFGEAYSPEGAK